MPSKKIVLASNNAGKVKEFNALLSPLGIEVIPQGLLGI
ncbi:MAG: non-canonical purine NTP pyrophosphatase, partial [Polynucleobacter victoriensis]